MARSGSPYIYTQQTSPNFVVQTTIASGTTINSDYYSNMNDNTVGGMVNVNRWTPDLFFSNNPSANLNSLSNLNGAGSNSNTAQGNTNSYSGHMSGPVMNNMNQLNMLQHQTQSQNQLRSQQGGLNLYSNVNGQLSGSSHLQQNVHDNFQYYSIEQQQEMELKAAAQKQREQQQQKNAQKLAQQVAQMQRNGGSTFSNGGSLSNGFPTSPSGSPLNMQQCRVVPNGNDGHIEKQPCQYGATCKYFTNEFTDKEKTEHHMKHYTHHANPCKFGATCKFYTGEFTDMEKYRPHMALFTHPPRNSNNGNASNKTKNNLHRNHHQQPSMPLNNNHISTPNLAVLNGKQIGAMNNISTPHLYNLQQMSDLGQQQQQQQQQVLTSSNSTPMLASNNNQSTMKSYRNIVLNNDGSQGQQGQQRQVIQQQGHMNVSGQSQNVTAVGNTNGILSGTNSSASLSSLMHPNNITMQQNNGSGSLSGVFSDDSSTISQQKNLYQMHNLHFLNENNNQIGLTNSENINMYNNLNRRNQEPNPNNSTNNTGNNLFVQLNQSNQVEVDNRYTFDPQFATQMQQMGKSYQYPNFPYNDQLYAINRDDQNLGMFTGGNPQKESGVNGEMNNILNETGNDRGKSIHTEDNNVHSHVTSSNSSSSGLSSHTPSTSSSRSGSGGIHMTNSLVKMQDNDQNSDDLSNSSSSYEEGSNTGGNNDRRLQDDSESNSLNNSKSSVSQGNGIRGDNSNHVNAFFMPYNTTNMLSDSTFASPSSVIDGNYTSAVGPLGGNVDVDATANKLLSFTINPNKNNVSNENSPKSFQLSHNGNQRNDNNRFMNDNGNVSNENEDFLKPDLSFLDGGNSYNGINSNQTNSPL